MGERLEEFKASFSYGSRSDLNFKFLKYLPDEEVAEFFRRLLVLLGDAYDTGDVAPLVQLAYETQVAGYAAEGDDDRWRYDDRPFTALQRPLAEATVGLLTSSGHFVAGDDPEPFGVAAMSQAEAERRVDDFLRSAPTLSAIPRDTPAEELRVRHPGYDPRSTRRDPNVTFPRDRLLELAAAGRVGRVAETLFSFTGATAQGRLRRLLPEWIDRLRATRIDALLLVPV